MIEREVLGCLLKDNSLIQETEIRAIHFEEQGHQLVFQTMLEMNEAGKAADRVTLMAENYQYMEQLGGMSFITQLESRGKIENFETYEKQLLDKYKKRESIKIATNWLAVEDNSIDHLLSELQRLEEIGVGGEIHKDEVLKDLALQPHVENAQDNGVPSGLKSLDDLTGGFQKKSSYVMGARPSMGKTALALKFAKSAMEKGVVPLIFSLEMDQESLLRRMISSIGRINMFYARNPHNLTPSQKESWARAVDELYAHDFLILDKTVQTIQYIRSRVRKATNDYPGRDVIVIIDYLTLIDSDGNFYSDHAKYTDISAKLKGIASDYDCPVITLAQLSRGVEQRQDKRPILSDLRESGSIEQDADGVMLLYRESYYDKGLDNDDLEIDLAKHRNGPTGTVKVYYNKATGIVGDYN